jgi:maltooligosyltrehalose trehalohydrolase
MHTFRVWAPLPKKVEIQVDGARHEMRAESGGWWRAEISGAGPGSDYGFILDGEGPFPDPRSQWQSQGIHGLSRIVDFSAFKWTDTNWHAPPLSSAVIYELHTGTFTPGGTFESAIEKLDHLVALGVTHVELMPVNEFSGARGWGYDGVDLFAPHHACGGPHGLMQFINACHVRQLAVIADVVYNHLGPSGNYLNRFAPYFTSHYSTPWGPAMNFDRAGSDEVRRFFCDNALMWLRDYHFDALRLDAVHAILDVSATPFLEQLGAEVRELEKKLGRKLAVTIENDLNDPRPLWPIERGGFALDAQWNDDFHHALHTVLTGERDGYYVDFGTIADIAKTMREGYVYDGSYSKFRNHSRGKKTVGLDGNRFIVCLQNHDQIGNRAKGERMSQLVNLNRLKVGAALLLTSPFVPLIFQGEEWAASTPFLYFTDHREKKLADAVREGRRREFAAFGWKPEEIPDPQAEETFQRSKLNWEELAREPHAEMLSWHRELIRLRRSEPALRDGLREKVRVNFDETSRWLVMERGPICVVCNLGSERQHIPLHPGNRVPLLSSTNEFQLSSGAVNLPPDSVAIFKS